MIIGLRIGRYRRCLPVVELLRAAEDTAISITLNGEGVSGEQKLYQRRAGPPVTVYVSQEGHASLEKAMY
jgi:hypothetical protein